ncbi:dTDP-4-dehydrorhamnose 3,5-epimerase [Actinokineospora auranticolor]|uniref:dTDP-4-dehydrorhamnose 3,5-epimerase n=1 Tax=Actinokineospora auranticolor TaxID=155976 RepID=A0A2S6GXF4_9PSEU|nr:dTDP-4-dehydrorhamnose 3,5-epimerase [Actinokineospora auranticolor]PPK69866.1 dTDP-4-dehydrorhamnose 3,5-epimerase [Actinokineospora auranticolor]
MHARELDVPDVFEFTPRTFPDSRGLFVSPFQAEALTKAVGHPLTIAQTNHSVSRRGAIRGIHFADVPPGQAKYVYCAQGAVLDYVVDIRVGSPTFGKWDVVRLDTVEFRAVYVAEGVGHGFVALEDDTVVSYLCSTGYNPAAEHGINPMDPDIALPWADGLEPLLSDKDKAAPSLKEAVSSGLLPTYGACTAWYETLRGV